jgi:hypothetical protein
LITDDETCLTTVSNQALDKSGIKFRYVYVSGVTVDVFRREEFNRYVRLGNLRRSHSGFFNVGYGDSIYLLSLGTTHEEGTFGAGAISANDNSGLSVGVIAAIVAGSVFICLLVSCGVWCCVRRKRAKKDNEAPMNPGLAPEPEKQTLKHQTISNSINRHAPNDSVPQTNNEAQPSIDNAHPATDDDENTNYTPPSPAYPTKDGKH